MKYDSATTLSLISHHPPLIKYSFTKTLNLINHANIQRYNSHWTHFSQDIEFCDVKLNAHLVLDLNWWWHYICVLIYFIMWITDEQEGYDQLIPDQWKRDAFGSRLALSHKLDINWTNVLIHRSLFTKVEHFSLHDIKDIGLKCAS